MGSGSIHVAHPCRYAMTKNASNHSDKSGPSFEDSLNELQQIVSDLEDGSLGLEQSMERFEAGMALLRQCYRVLEQAEQKIEILTGFDSEGNPITAEFYATATHDPARAAAGRRARRTPDETNGPDAEPQDSGPRLF